LPCAGWKQLLTDVGFSNIVIGEPCDTFSGANGEENARDYDVFGYAFMAIKPS
jgi:hypothetical protein